MQGRLVSQGSSARGGSSQCSRDNLSSGRDPMVKDMVSLQVEKMPLLVSFP